MNPLTDEGADVMTPGATTAVLTTLAAVGSVAGLAATIGGWTAIKVLACLIMVVAEVLIGVGVWMIYQDFEDRRPQAIVNAAKAALKPTGPPLDATPEQVAAARAAEAEAHLALPDANIIKAIGEAIKAAATGLSKLRPAVQLILLGFAALGGVAALLRLTP